MTLGKLISNLLFCGIFALAGLNHISHFEEELPKLVQVGIPEELAPICFGVSIALLLIGTIFVISMRYEVFGYVCYIAFLVPVTYFMHVVPIITVQFNPSNPDAAKIEQLNLIQALKNVALIGACFKLILAEFEKQDQAAMIDEKKRK